MKRKIDILSDFIILYNKSKGLSTSPLKLQKLLYYVQVWSIIKFDKDIFFDELAEAWVNGPVYRSVYNQYKNSFYKNEDLSKDVSDNDIEGQLKNKLDELKIDSDRQDLLFDVLDSYSILSDEKLVFLTHKELPWNEARKGLSPIDRSTASISVDSIYNYYTARLRGKNEQ